MSLALTPKVAEQVGNTLTCCLNTFSQLSSHMISDGELHEGAHTLPERGSHV